MCFRTLKLLVRLRVYTYKLKYQRVLVIINIWVFLFNSGPLYSSESNMNWFTLVLHWAWFNWRFTKKNTIKCGTSLEYYIWLVPVPGVKHSLRPKLKITSMMFFIVHSILLYCSPVQSTHANKHTTPQHKQTNDDRGLTMDKQQQSNRDNNIIIEQ